LFRDLIFSRPYARLIDTVNAMPTMTDYQGLGRRVLPLYCNEPLVPTKQNRFLAEQILAEERDGMFTRWMRALNRLIERGGFAVSAGVQNDITEYIENASGLTAQWVRECCAPMTNPKDYASNDTLWNAYTAWALQHASSETDRHTSIITWGKALKSLGYPTVNARRGHEYIKARKLTLKNLTVAAS
jgi:phage/plasmid-associated DNA primase